MRFYGRSTKLVVYADGKAHTYESKPGKLGLDVDFDIRATLTKEPNQASPIRVHKLSKDSQKLFSEAHQAVEFWAGYGDDLVLAFSGTTSNVVSSKLSSGYATEIYAGDGLKEFETRYFNKSYRKGTPVIFIFKALADALGLPSVIDAPSFPNRLQSGTSYFGRARDVLDMETKNHGYTWSVQNGRVEIIEASNPFRPEPTAVVVRADTGMVGSAQLITRTVVDDKKKKKKKKDKDEKPLYGVRFTTLLNPELRPGRLVKLESAQPGVQVSDLLKNKIPSLPDSGIYIAKNIRYYGSNYGVDTPYYMEVEADIND